MISAFDCLGGLLFLSPLIASCFLFVAVIAGNKHEKERGE